MTHLWVRAEQRPNEERVGITPLWNEIAYPLSTYFKFFTGQIVLAPVPYAARTGAPIQTSET